MNRKEFIKKFSLLTAALATIPDLYAGMNNEKKIPGLIKDPNGILDLPKGFTYSIFHRYSTLSKFDTKIPNLIVRTTPHFKQHSNSENKIIHTESTFIQINFYPFESKSS